MINRLYSVCGMDETGVDAFLEEAEKRDVGTERHPWPPEFKAEVKATIDGMSFMPDVKRTVNSLVLSKLGPGLFNKGPFLEPIQN